MNRLLLCCLLCLLGAGLLWTPAAHADVTCQASIQGGNINFGNVDPSSSAYVDVPATISYTCKSTDSQAQPLTLCFNMGYSAAGAAADGNRQMSGTGSSVLEFQLYRDSARTQIAGSIYEVSMPLPAQAQFSVPKRGTAAGSVNVYARLPGNQTSAAGSYNAAINPRLTGSIGYVSCTNTYEDGISTMSPFNVVANVPRSCSAVAASSLDFGQSTGLLTTNMDQTSAINVTCVNGTPYQVGLGNGTNANGNVRRMALNGGTDYVTYEIYRDSARSQRWGNTLDSDTVTGTGNGQSQQIPVYGRIASQLTPTPGNYLDTVTVFVYY